MKVLHKFKTNLRSFLLLYRILKISSEGKSNKIIFLSVLLIINGLAELLSLASIVPLLSILSDPESLPKSKLFNFLLNIFQIQSDNVILFSTIIFIIFILFSLVMRVSTLKYGYNLIAELGTNLGTKTLTNIIYQPYSFQTKQNSGEIINILTTEVEYTTNSMMIAIRFATALVTFLFILFGMLYFNIYIALGCFILFGTAYLLITKKSSKRIKNNSFIITQSNNKIVKHIQNTIGSIRDLIIDNNHDFYISTYQKLQRKKRFTVVENNIIGAYPAYLFESLAFISFALTGLAFSITIENPSESISILGTIAIGLQKLLRSMQQIYLSIIKVNSKKNSYEIILDSFKQKINPGIFELEKESLSFNSSIHLQNINFRYSSELPWTIKNLNLELQKGEIIGLIGETGSGKSTLIDLIMGLLIPTEGEVLIDKINITEDYNSRKKWFNSISHVPQDIYLCDGTFAENIALGISKEKIDYEKIIKASKAAKIKEFIESSPMGFETLVGERGIKLSGGQRQRIAIARSIYKKSKLLVFDEATSALDNKTEDEIIKSINDLGDNITIIMIAHRLSSLSFCNKIIELRNGEIISCKKSID